MIPHVEIHLKMDEECKVPEWLLKSTILNRMTLLIWTLPTSHFCQSIKCVLISQLTVSKQTKLEKQIEVYHLVKVQEKAKPYLSFTQRRAYHPYTIKYSWKYSFSIRISISQLVASSESHLYIWLGNFRECKSVVFTDPSRVTSEELLFSRWYSH